MGSASAAAAAASPLSLLRHHHHPYLNLPLSVRQRLTSSGFGISSIQCSSDSTRGFGPKPQPQPQSTNTKKIKSSPPIPKHQSSSSPNQAPGLSNSIYTSDDLEFEQRLQAIKKSALEQKKAQAQKVIGVIDYDAPTENNSSSTTTTTTGLGTKIGVGVAVVVFGLVFALGDFLPFGSVGPTEEAATVKKIPEQERAFLEKRLKEFEETLATSPEDSTALEGAAVTLAEMQEYKRATTLLEKLTEKKPRDPDAFRLLGEVKYEIKDYEGSVLAYRSAEKASRGVDFEILRGLTNSLLAAKKPDEAVQMLLAARDCSNREQTSGDSDGTVTAEMGSDVDPIQVELLLGKAYSDWGHISDAVAIYDQLISRHPDDFRGYLAKGIILRGNGSIGDAERMFIQARFFAPDKAKALVDKYSR